MIGMVLVTHGQLANGFRAALEHVVGPQSQFETIAIGPEDDMEQRRSDILDAASRVQDGSGVVLLTDMFGGTPSNLAISAILRRVGPRTTIVARNCSAFGCRDSPSIRRMGRSTAPMRPCADLLSSLKGA